MEIAAKKMIGTFQSAHTNRQNANAFSHFQMQHIHNHHYATHKKYSIFRRKFDLDKNTKHEVFMLECCEMLRTYFRFI